MALKETKYVPLKDCSVYNHVSKEDGQVVSPRDCGTNHEGIVIDSTLVESGNGYKCMTVSCVSHLNCNLKGGL